MCLGPCAGHYFFVPVSVPDGEGFRHADVVFIVKIMSQHETKVEGGSRHTLMATTPRDFCTGHPGILLYTIRSPLGHCIIQYLFFSSAGLKFPCYLLLFLGLLAWPRTISLCFVIALFLFPVSTYCPIYRRALE